MNNILEIRNLYKEYNVKPGIFSKEIHLPALRDISLRLEPGKTLGIVGESGCGKSTLAKVLTLIEDLKSGEIILDDVKLETPENISSEFQKNWYQKIQMVFQDPYQSLNPRKRVWEIIADPKIVSENLSKDAAKNEAILMMEKVGLRKELAERYPHQFSGGQRQRIGIARALMLRPKVLILDEPVSALDVSVQAQVLNLLLELQREMNLSYLFISHDLSVVQHVSDDILVMYLGEVVEYGPRDEVFKHPKHPYTKMLLASAPKVNAQAVKEEIEVCGEIPSLFDLPSGCAFASRCPYFAPECQSKIEMQKIQKSQVRCIKA